jgi:hypothetical protein
MNCVFSIGVETVAVVPSEPGMTMGAAVAAEMVVPASATPTATVDRNRISLSPWVSAEYWQADNALLDDSIRPKAEQCECGSDSLFRPSVAVGCSPAMLQPD